MLEASSGNSVESNEIFSATIDPSFTTGTTFTIDGDGSQPVVLNISATGAISLNGIIALTGGITSDQVLFNFDAGDYSMQTGGAILTIDTSGLTITGTYVDPNGAVIVENSTIVGRVFDGGSSNGAIINSTITAPIPVPIAPVPVPEPTSLALLAAGLAAFSTTRLRPRPRWRS